MEAKAWQPECPLIDDWVKERWYTYMMEYNSAIRKGEMLPFGTTLMNVETLMLSEISPMEKVKDHVMSLICRI